MWLKQCKRKDTASSRFHSVDVLFDLGVCLTWVRLHVWTSVQVTGSQLSGCCFSIGQTVTVGKGQVFFLSVQLHLPVLQASILYSNTKENGSSFGLPIVPTYLHNMFRTKSNDHTYLLRSSVTGQLDVPRQHTRSLSLIGPKLWNNLNKEIRNCTTLSSFQSKLKHFLLCTTGWTLC